MTGLVDGRPRPAVAWGKWIVPMAFLVGLVVLPVVDDAMTRSDDTRIADRPPIVVVLTPDVTPAAPVAPITVVEPSDVAPVPIPIAAPPARP